MTTTEGQGPELERERREHDHDRAEARELFDRTRQGRGDGQARDRLRRERAREDDSLNAERDLADARLAREKQARADAEEDTRRCVAREDRRTLDLKDVVALVESQVRVVDDGLSRMLAVVPRGAFEGELSESVGTVRTALARMRRLLADALDPEEAQRRERDQGGSG